MPYDINKDRFSHLTGAPSSPGRRLRAITPSNTADLVIYASALYVGTAGDVALIATGDGDAESVILRSVPAGAIIPVQTRRVLATGTTATNILAILS